MSTPLFLLPSNVNYECQCCGDCCQTWGVGISKKEAEKFSLENWNATLKSRNANCWAARENCQVIKNQEQLPTNQSNKYIITDYELSAQIEEGSDKKCVFLNDKNLCEMQVEKGFDYKSHVCKSYPFKLYHLHDGTIQIGTSFYCPGILSNTRTPLDVNSLTKLLDDENDKISLSENLLFFENVEISLENMNTINNFISDFLFRPETSVHLNEPSYKSSVQQLSKLRSEIPDFEDRLTVGIIFVNLLKKLSMQLINKDKENFNSLLANELSKSELMTELLKKCHDIFLKQPEKNLGPIISGLFIHLRQFAAFKAKNLKNVAGLVFNIIKTFLKCGGFYFEDYATTISLAKHSKIRFDLTDDETAKLIEKYLSMIIFRKITFYSAGMLNGYKKIALFYSLIKWYAKAFAVIRKSESANYEDVFKAIRFVEKYFVYHSGLITKVQEVSYFNSFYDPLFENFSILKSIIKLS